MRIYKYCYNNEVSYYFTNNNKTYIYFHNFGNRHWSKALYSTLLPSTSIEINIYELLFGNKELIDMFFFNTEIENKSSLLAYFTFETIKKELEMIYKGE